MNALGPHPWELSFSYGRALQAPSLKAWGGEDANVQAGQQALAHRARMNGAARDGSYRPSWRRSRPLSSRRTGFSFDRLAAELLGVKAPKQIDRHRILERTAAEEAREALERAPTDDVHRRLPRRIQRRGVRGRNEHVAVGRKGCRREQIGGRQSQQLLWEARSLQGVEHSLEIALRRMLEPPVGRPRQRSRADKLVQSRARPSRDGPSQRTRPPARSSGPSLLRTTRSPTTSPASLEAVTSMFGPPSSTGASDAQFESAGDSPASSSPSLAAASP